MGREFTRGDKIIFVASYAWTFIWTLVFIVGTSHNLSHEVDDSAWAAFWKVYVTIQVVMAVFVIVWFTIGGARDIRSMFRSLRSMVRHDLEPSEAPVILSGHALPAPACYPCRLQLDSLGR